MRGIPNPVPTTGRPPNASDTANPDSLIPSSTLNQTFGTSAGTQDFKSVAKADVIVVIGATPSDGHPVCASRM
jgi:predicted molibdopterin-dependent oxidoreductase YjgC